MLHLIGMLAGKIALTASRWQGFVLFMMLFMAIGAFGGYKLCKAVHAMQQVVVEKKAHKQAEKHIEYQDREVVKYKEIIKYVDRYVKDPDRQCFDDDDLRLFNDS